MPALTRAPRLGGTVLATRRVGRVGVAAAAPRWSPSVRAPACTVALSTSTLLLFLALSALAPAPAAARQAGSGQQVPPSAPGTTLTGPAKVADGDTLEIQTPNGPARVRLWGVDAPELAQSCKRSDGQAWACGETAKEALKSALGDLTAVTCVTKQVDQYGRNVAACSGPSGADAGKALVKEGLAVEYRVFSNGAYSRDEKDARQSKAGMWDGTFQQPAEWRKEKRAQEFSGGGGGGGDGGDGARASTPIAVGELGGGGVVGDPAAVAGAGAAGAAAPAPAPATADPHPAGCDIKGNISQRGRRVYHTPASPAYASVKVDTAAGERWFCSEAEAEKAGWTKAKPGGRPAKEEPEV